LRWRLVLEARTYVTAGVLEGAVLSVGAFEDRTLVVANQSLQWRPALRTLAFLGRKIGATVHLDSRLQNLLDYVVRATLGYVWHRSFGCVTLALRL
jgi:hypothetical protein